MFPLCLVGQNEELVDDLNLARNDKTTFPTLLISQLYFRTNLELIHIISLKVIHKQYVNDFLFD